MNFKISTDKTVVNKSSKKIFSFLGNFENFEKLMPEQVSNWNATELDCSFTIKNMGDIRLKIVEKKEDSHIHITSVGDLPFDVDMKAHIEPFGEDQTKVHIDLEGNMSQMIFMMAKKPLQNLANHIVERLKEHHK